jgi:catechol 2,3-dioxygenase-like lactoylglutathione lyase family enzyme
MKMHHVGLSVADIDKSIAFYELLGMEKVCEVFRFEGPQFSKVMGLENAQGRMGLVRKGDVQLELFEFANPSPRPKARDCPVADHGYTHFGFEVDDIEATYERLLAAGAQFHAPVTTFPGGMKATYGRDPDGNVFEIMQQS